jgi:hypothetical protein
MEMITSVTLSLLSRSVREHDTAVQAQWLLGRIRGSVSKLMVTMETWCPGLEELHLLDWLLYGRVCVWSDACKQRCECYCNESARRQGIVGCLCIITL